jgi:hypothetical protein
VTLPAPIRRALALFAMSTAAWAALPSGVMAQPWGPTGHGPVRTARQVFDCRLRAVRLGPEITVTYRLNSTIAGRRWKVSIRHDDVTILSRIRRTNADGNLRVETMTVNEPGRDAFLGRARDLVSGGVCRVTLEV